LVARGTLGRLCLAMSHAANPKKHAALSAARWEGKEVDIQVEVAAPSPPWCVMIKTSCVPVSFPLFHLIAGARAAHRDVWVGGEQPETAVTELETTLGVRLPPGYRRFVTSVGGLDVDGMSISGILEAKGTERRTGWLYGDTMRFQQERKLPSHLLVFQPDDDAPYCFDTSRPDASGEFPIICFDLHSRHEERVARNFDEWLETFAFSAADGAG
jgi:SMI1-KNR4 cell-wall